MLAESWLERRRQLYDRTTIASEQRKSLRNYIIPPLAEFVVGYAERTDDDFENDVFSDRLIETTADRQAETDRLLASSSEALPNGNCIDLYLPTNGSTYAVVRQPVSRWFDEPVNAFCTLRCIGGRGGRYYSSSLQSKNNFIIRVEPDDNKYESVVEHPFAGAISELSYVRKTKRRWLSSSALIKFTESIRWRKRRR